MSQGFRGFPKDALAFLIELKANNEREWFEDNRQRYEDSIRTPALEYITAMQAPLAKVSKHFEAVPKKVGGSLMRIHRDVRFSADKSPYKTNIGIHFRHSAGRDVHAPGFYVHLDPEEAFFGVGIWHPQPEALEQIRKAVSQRPDDWRKARDAKAFATRFQLAGDSAKRPPRGFDKTHPEIKDIQRKDFIALQNAKAKLFQSPDLVDETTRAFKDASPFMKFLCESLKLPY